MSSSRFFACFCFFICFFVPLEVYHTDDVEREQCANQRKNRRKSRFSLVFPTINMMRVLDPKSWLVVKCAEISCKTDMNYQMLRPVRATR
jgi:hypothetical protein